MSNWKTDFEVKFRLEFKHEDGRKEIKNNSLIVEAENEDKAIEMVINEYDNSVFLKVDEVKKIWNCLLYTSPSPRDTRRSRMPSSA